MDSALEAHDERRNILAIAAYREALSVAAIDQIGGRTNAP
jgi:hypothetical protein